MTQRMMKMAVYLNAPHSLDTIVCEPSSVAVSSYSSYQKYVNGTTSRHSTASSEYSV